MIGRGYGIPIEHSITICVCVNFGTIVFLIFFFLIVIRVLILLVHAINRYKLEEIPITYFPRFKGINPEPLLLAPALYLEDLLTLPIFKAPMLGDIEESPPRLLFAPESPPKPSITGVLEELDWSPVYEFFIYPLDPDFITVTESD